MVGDDLKVLKDGSVEGTFKYVTGFTEFSSDSVEQEGYYFPFKLTQQGKKMTLKKNGSAAPEKTDMQFDPEIILRISKDDTFEIIVDEKSVVTFSFIKADFEERTRKHAGKIR